jgi:Arc/MetJ-type ribon-helix-helix transcriptional regulator
MDDPTLTLELTPRELGWLDEAVAAGAYPSREAILREALELWRAREEDTADIDAALKRAYDESMADDPGEEVDPQALLADMKSRWAARG